MNLFIENKWLILKRNISNSNECLESAWTHYQGAFNLFRCCLGIINYVHQIEYAIVLFWSQLLCQKWLKFFQYFYHFCYVHTFVLFEIFVRGVKFSQSVHINFGNVIFGNPITQYIKLKKTWLKHCYSKTKTFDQLSPNRIIFQNEEKYQLPRHHHHKKVYRYRRVRISVQ